jgi:hypothetical protein
VSDNVRSRCGEAQRILEVCNSTHTVKNTHTCKTAGSKDSIGTFVVRGLYNVTVEEISLEQEQFDRGDEVELRRKQLVRIAGIAEADHSRSVVCGLETNEAIGPGD